jgi:hypothetical protein
MNTGTFKGKHSVQPPSTESDKDTKKFFCINFPSRSFGQFIQLNRRCIPEHKIGTQFQIQKPDMWFCENVHKIKHVYHPVLHSDPLSLSPWWPQSASKLYRPSDRRLSAKLVPDFAGRVCCVVSDSDPSGGQIK